MCQHVELYTEYFQETRTESSANATTTRLKNTFQFSLSPSFIGPLHGSIKQNVPGLSKDLSQALAEVYYKVSSFSFHIFIDNKYLWTGYP